MTSRRSVAAMESNVGTVYMLVGGWWGVTCFSLLRKVEKWYSGWRGGMMVLVDKSRVKVGRG